MDSIWMGLCFENCTKSIITQQLLNGEKIGDCSMIDDSEYYLSINKPS